MFTIRTVSVRLPPETNPLNKLLFASYHCCLDWSNGAAITAREILSALPQWGWNVNVLSGTMLDSPEDIEQIIADRVLTAVTRLKPPNASFSLRVFTDNGIRFTLFCPAIPSPIPSETDCNHFLQLLRSTIANTRPDILLTYGGYSIGPATLRFAKESGIKTAVLLQNLAYKDAEYFIDADAVIVPSRFAQKYYAEKLGIQSVVIPPLLSADTQNLSDQQRQRRYITYVNPEPGKGMTWFAKITKILNDRKPDSEFLVVEGRGKVQQFARTGFLLDGINNLRVMANTPNPSDFLQVSKIVLIPSYYEETFGRIAVEAMMNGIPVIASNRGALPEVVGNAGILLSIPDRFQPNSLEIPSDVEVEQWIDAIVRLWDDREYYDSVCRRCLEHAARWCWNDVARQYESFFSALQSNGQ